MGSVDLYGAAVPLYTSGSGAERFAEIFGPLGFRIEVAGPEAGTAAAVKMLRSVVTKGMEALLVEALTAATLAGVRHETMRGLCASMDATTFSKFLDMCVRSNVLHAERRAVEMDGVAAGLRELGFDPVMTAATAERLKVSARLGLRAEFARRSGYSADDVLDRYARVLSGPGGEPRGSREFKEGP
jgi:3-hydroxyisobutyrate dehydrogenase-like beta-hydroxyacid dehydrogenase